MTPDAKMREIADRIFLLILPVYRERSEEARRPEVDLIEQELRQVAQEARREAIEEAAAVATRKLEPNNGDDGFCYECDCHGECPQKIIPKNICALLNQSDSDAESEAKK
jgi:hypothetical protein